MKKNIILSLVTVVVFVLFLKVDTISAAAATLYPDYISDEDFAICLVNQNSELTSTDQTLTQTEFDTFAQSKTTIDCSNENVDIKSLEGIDSFTALDSLNLSASIDSSQSVIYDQINQVSTLEQLVLDDNNIGSIPDFTLNNLFNLSLSNNNITNIENLDNLPSLDMLFLNDNNISEMENLDNLTNLGSLSLENNSISEINLNGLDNVTLLTLDNNDISSLQGIENQTKLIHLSLNGNNISTLEELSNLTNLGDIRLNGNNIVDLNQFDYISDSAFSIYASGQEYVSYQLPNNTYNEVVRQETCGESSSCEFDSYTNEIDGGAYTQTIDNSSNADVVTYNLEVIDGLPYYDNVISNINYSANITIVNYKNVTATNGEDYYLDAQRSEDDLKQKLNVDIDVYDLDTNQYVSKYDDIYISDLNGYDYDDPQPGSYKITFKLDAEQLSEAEITVTYTVFDPTSISATDNSVDINDAPSNEEELFDILSVEALDFDGTQINESVIINNKDNYDYDNPQVGVYEFEFRVTGTDNYITTITATLTVTEEVVDPVDPTDPETPTEPETPTDPSDPTDNVEITDNTDEIASTGVTYNLEMTLLLTVLIFILASYKVYKR